jgi:peptide deformylase|tara:strand:- start:70 stop:564 length:495 start_codon:yes stop_codon:yes gene_type:complete
MNLIYYPNKFLDKQVKPFDLDNPPVDPKELKDNMVDIMLSNNGIGLAANQVEFDGQVFVMGDKENNTTILINPQILQHTQETVQDMEGCLSFPGIYVKVTRPKDILAEWYDENLEKQTAKIDGYTAKCFLHEWDHLQGITFKDRVSKLKWNMATKKARKLLKNV